MKKTIRTHTLKIAVLAITFFLLFVRLNGQTITTGTIAGPLCAGSVLPVPYTISGIFNSGNVFTVQLSNGTGSFTSPTTTIGTLNSTTGGAISCTIPADITSGTGYLVQVVSSNPAVTGSNNGSPVVINAISATVTGDTSPVCANTDPGTYTVTVASTYTNLLNFTTATGNANGSEPVYTQFLQAPNGLLYGTTEDGGTNSQGNLFSFNPATNTYTDLVDLNVYTPPVGGNPEGSLIYDAANGLMYGIAHTDGTNGHPYGVLFSYNPTTNIYDTLHCFGFNFGVDVLYPSPGLVLAKNGVVYGTAMGGPNIDGHTNGAIFSFNPDSNIFSVPYYFPVTVGTGLFLYDSLGEVSGTTPITSLMLGSNNLIYGTAGGGIHSSGGVIFSFDPDSNLYTKLYDFNDTTGDVPSNGPLLQVGNLLYGSTGEGGAHNDGVIFSFDPASHAYTDLFDFDGTTGAGGNGGLIQASNGLLYGVGGSGGASNYGVIFSFDITTGAYSELFNFPASVSMGTNPRAGLMQASNGLLYGMTTQGGANTPKVGVIYSYNPIQYTYHWYLDGAATGITTPTYDPGNLIATSTLYCAITGGGCTVNTATTTIAVNDSPPCPAFCSARYTLYPDTAIPHHWYALNQATGSGPLAYLWNWGDGDTSTGVTPMHIYSDSGHYNICLTITDSTGCTSTYCDSSTFLRSTESLMITINVVTSLPVGTGIPPVGKGASSVSIYPNPANNSFVVETNSSGKQVLQVFDVTGKLMLAPIIFNAKTIVNASNLAVGIYIVSLKNADGVATGKLVIAR